MILSIIAFVLGIILGIALAYGFMGLRDWIMGFLSPKKQKEEVI